MDGVIPRTAWKRLDDYIQRAYSTQFTSSYYDFQYDPANANASLKILGKTFSFAAPSPDAGREGCAREALLKLTPHNLLTAANVHKARLPGLRSLAATYCNVRTLPPLEELFPEILKQSNSAAAYEADNSGWANRGEWGGTPLHQYPQQRQQDRPAWNGPPIQVQLRMPSNSAMERLRHFVFEIYGEQSDIFEKIETYQPLKMDKMSPWTLLLLQREYHGQHLYSNKDLNQEAASRAALENGALSHIVTHVRPPTQQLHEAAMDIIPVWSDTKTLPSLPPPISFDHTIGSRTPIPPRSPHHSGAQSPYHAPMINGWGSHGPGNGSNAGSPEDRQSKRARSSSRRRSRSPRYRHRSRSRANRERERSFSAEHMHRSKRSASRRQRSSSRGRKSTPRKQRSPSRGRRLSSRSLRSPSRGRRSITRRQRSSSRGRRRSSSEERGSGRKRRSMSRSQRSRGEPAEDGQINEDRSQSPAQKEVIQSRSRAIAQSDKKRVTSPNERAPNTLMSQSAVQNGSSSWSPGLVKDLPGTNGKDARHSGSESAQVDYRPNGSYAKDRSETNSTLKAPTTIKEDLNKGLSPFLDYLLDQLEKKENLIGESVSDSNNGRGENRYGGDKNEVHKLIDKLDSSNREKLGIIKGACALSGTMQNIRSAVRLNEIGPSELVVLPRSWVVEMIRLLHPASS